MPVSRHSLALVIGSLVMTGMPVEAAPPFPFFKEKEVAPQQSVQWQHDLPTAYKLANEQHKPMLIVFGAEWCHFCKKMDKETLATPGIAQLVNDSFIPVHLDADKEKRAVEILQISGLPCSVVVSPQAQMLGRIEGYRKPDEFQKQLTLAKQRHQIAQQTAGAQPAAQR